MRAVWRNSVIAQSDETVLVEGNHYFPMSSIKEAHFEPSDKSTYCPWKGTASYFDIVVNNERNPAAGWWYPEPTSKASHISNRIAFWNGVEIKP